MPKIREVDKEMTAVLQERVMEFHPEVAWTRLAGALLFSKHTAAGLIQRMRLLRACVPSLDELDRWKDNQAHAKATLDDILDALVGLAVASDFLGQVDGQHRLPEDTPPTDDHGLRMEIWY